MQQRRQCDEPSLLAATTTPMGTVGVRAEAAVVQALERVGLIAAQVEALMQVLVVAAGRERLRLPVLQTDFGCSSACVTASWCEDAACRLVDVSFRAPAKVLFAVTWTVW